MSMSKWSKAMGLPTEGGEDFPAAVEAMLTAQSGGNPPDPIDRSPYPLPGYALSMWLVGGHIHIALAQVDGKGRPHTVRVPLDKCPASEGTGWAFIVDLMKARERAGRTSSESRIGSKAAPSHTQVEDWMRRNAKRTPMTAPEARGPGPKKAPKREANSLDDLGL